MDEPGIFDLCELPLAGAATQTGTVVDGLAGMISLGLAARLQLGAATPDAAVTAIVQTSLDGGQTWFDLACFGWSGQGGGLQVAQLVPAGVAPVAPPIGALAAGAVMPGAVLGDRLRAIVTVTGGGYSNATLLSLWAVVR